MYIMNEGDNMHLTINKSLASWICRANHSDYIGLRLVLKLVVEPIEIISPRSYIDTV